MEWPLAMRARIQELAEQSDNYATLVSDILDDLREKFEGVPFGRLLKTTTGWPRLAELIEVVRHFGETF
jgi:hypothetical protein